jgi:hypothetical protein
MDLKKFKLLMAIYSKSLLAYCNLDYITKLGGQKKKKKKKKANVFEIGKLVG